MLPAALLLSSCAAAAAAGVTLADRRTLSSARKLVEKEMRQVRAAIVHQYGSSYNNAARIDGGRLAELWSHAFMFTAQNTWRVFEDGTTFVSTGDIGNMWLRDSTVQLLTYVPVAAAEPDGNPLQLVLESAMARQVRFIRDDPYSSAFYFKHGPGETGGPNKYECPPAPNCEECICNSCSPPCGNYTYQQDFELDSLLYPLHLHYRYWRATKITRHLTGELLVALRVILDVLRTEQWHFSKSKYYYQRDPPRHKEGIGLIWSYAVPSDERAGRGYNVPQNIMAVVVLRQAAELAGAAPLGDAALAADLRGLADEVDRAVQRYGVVRAPGGERVYAFQTDGWGNYTITDDANMPNLLWLPYLGYDDAAGVYRATRRFVLSRQNSNFHSGRFASGLGSPHHSYGLRDRNPGPECNSNCVWHLGLVMQGMTAESFTERARCMRQVLATDAGQNLLHEGFDPDDPKSYNRDGFGWADALFSEWVMRDWVNQTTTPTNVIAATVQV